MLLLIHPVSLSQKKRLKETLRSPINARKVYDQKSCHITEEYCGLCMYSNPDFRVLLRKIPPFPTSESLARHFKACTDLV